MTSSPPNRYSARTSPASAAFVWALDLAPLRSGSVTRRGVQGSALLLLLGASVPVACSSDDGGSGSQESSTATTEVAEPVLPGTPAEVGQFALDWPTAGQDYDNSRTAASSTITADNIDSLEEGWRAEWARYGLELAERPRAQ